MNLSQFDVSGLQDRLALEYMHVSVGEFKVVSCGRDSCDGSGQKTKAKNFKKHIEYE